MLKPDDYSFKLVIIYGIDSVEFSFLNSLNDDGATIACGD